jgi:pentatricopeptide repeat protein
MENNKETYTNSFLLLPQSHVSAIHTCALGVPCSCLLFQVVYQSSLKKIKKPGCVIERKSGVLLQMRRQGLLPDLLLCTSLLQACGGSGMVAEAEQLFRDMQDAGIVPDVRACNVMMDVYARAGMVPEAEGLLEEMKEMGLRPNKFTYTAVIIG